MGVGYNPKIVTDGLVLYLDAANIKSYPKTGTVWTDLGPNKNIGTLTNGPVYTSANNSFLFDGFNLTTIPSVDSLNFSTGIFTVGVWLKVNSFPSTTAHAVVSKKARYNASSIGWSCHLDNRTSGFMQLRMNDGSVANDSTPTTSANNTVTFTTPTNWIYLVWAATTNSVSFYINGLLNSSTSYSYPNVSNTTAVEIGKPSAGFDSSPNMYINSVSIYNKQLTGTEVLQNFNALRGRYSI